MEKKSLLKKIQDSDDSVKTKLVIICSIVSGTMVFFFWLYCMKNTIQSVSATSVAKIAGPSPVEVFKNASKEITNAFSSRTQELMQKLNNGRTVEVK